LPPTAILGFLEHLARVYALAYGTQRNVALPPLEEHLLMA